VGHRTKATNGPGSRSAGLAVAFKLIEAARDRWRAVNALRAQVQWATYARLVVGDGAVVHIAGQGQAPPDRPAVALTAPAPDVGAVTAIVVLRSTV
jgi:hypothetical protein